MVAENSVRTYGVNNLFRFVKGIWLHRQTRYIRFFFSRNSHVLLHTCATFSELPSYISTMGQTNPETVVMILPPYVASLDLDYLRTWFIIKGCARAK